MRLQPAFKYRWRATTGQNFIVDCSPIEIEAVTEIDGGTQFILEVPPVNFTTMDGGVECPLVP